MSTPIKSRFVPVRMVKQRGMVLFFAMVALLAISLAAVALIRSVDTSTLISGNIAFKQVATASADSGVEAAMAWIAGTQAANSGLAVRTDITHPFNNDAPTAGYYSSINPALSLTNGTGIQWTNADSVLVGTDANGNTTRYVIQRMCRTANALPSTQEQPALVPPSTACLFGEAQEDGNSKSIQRPQDVCVGGGCADAIPPPMLRITSRTAGPRNTVSYVQAFVY